LLIYRDNGEEICKSPQLDHSTYLSPLEKKKEEIKQFSARNLTISNNLKGNAHIENMSLKKGASRLSVKAT